MRKFISICVCLLLGAFINVSYGADNPTKSKPVSSDSYMIPSQDLAVVSYDIYFYNSDVIVFRVYENRTEKVLKGSANINLHFATVVDPVRLGDIRTRYKVNKLLDYKHPFVDRSYVWKFQHQYNC